MDPEALAVVLALAGVRGGDRVAQIGAGERVERGLLAMAGAAAASSQDAQVVVSGGPEDVQAAAGLLAPGGRLVGLAADAVTARADAAGAGIASPHLVGMPDGRVAWSGRAPV